MSLHKEIKFEVEISEYLAANDWLYSANDDGYDRARALFPEDVLAWVQETQPKAWESIVKNHGTNAADTLLSRLRDQLDQRGTLDVIRQGVEMLGLRGKLLLSQFKPALAIARRPSVHGKCALVIENGKNVRMKNTPPAGSAKVPKVSLSLSNIS